jgi:hypothetical protein
MATILLIFVWSKKTFEDFLLPVANYVSAESGKFEIRAKNCSFKAKNESHNSNVLVGTLVFRIDHKHNCKF